MNRYERTPITINKKNQRVLRITRYPQIPIKDSDRFIYPRDGDRLDNGLGKGRTILNPNFQIRIPGNVTQIISDFENLNR